MVASANITSEHISSQGLDKNILDVGGDGYGNIDIQTRINHTPYEQCLYSYHL